ncbi:hypothetical protein F511_42054 [Dorcoceras hygrometricum]|uniref:Uncharacterized protein n=1 Tax=Dorcoceras hygrometricum TaxID=472368 RepID=A0A2Z7BU30_9LAMI|nr:hypothetical protein F511_42054 [Dorcoceras hygrometricum]
MSNVEQEADNSKRNSEESDVVLKNQQMVRVQQMKKTAGALSIDDVISSDITISRKLLLTSRYRQLHPDESFGVIFNKSRIHSKRRRSNKLIRHRLIYPVVGSPVASISRPTTGQPAASTSRRNQQYIQTRSTVDQLLICIQSQAESQALQDQRLYNQSQHNEKKLPVDWIAKEQKPDAEKTTAERTAVEQFVGEYSAIQRNQRSRWKESMAEIESCKLPQFKGTRFVLFLEIVQFTEERCTEMERRRISAEKTTAERTAVEQFVGEYSAIQRNQRSRWKESMAEIESCKLPQFKGTRFVLFLEIVQFTEERCTEMERRRISLDKRRRVLESI